jgi:hypothetical protein
VGGNQSATAGGGMGFPIDSYAVLLMQKRTEIASDPEGKQ